MQWETVAAWDWQLWSWIAVVFGTAVVILPTIVKTVANVVRFFARLWRTHNAQKIKLRGYCYVRKDVPYRDVLPEFHQDAHDAPKKHDRFLLCVKNRGGMSATITAIKIKIGRFGSIRIHEILFNLWITLGGDKSMPIFLPAPDSSTLPTNVAGGEEKEWSFSLRSVVWRFAAGHRNGERLISTKAEAKSLRFLVCTSIGKTTSIKPHKQVIDAIIKGIDKHSASM